MAHEFAKRPRMRTLPLAMLLAALFVPIGARAQVPTPSPEPSAAPSAVASEAPSALPSVEPSVEMRTIYQTAVPGQTGGTPGKLPICSTATIVPIDTMNSKDADPGQAFQFTVTSIDDPRKLYAMVAPGEKGYGVVSVVKRGRTGGEPGLLVLETRYIMVPGGDHVPVSLLRSVNGLFLGRTNNSPALLGFIPYVGYVTSTYDALHKGGNTSAGPSDSLIVLLGDEEIAGACTPPPPPTK